MCVRGCGGEAHRVSLETKRTSVTSPCFQSEQPLDVLPGFPGLQLTLINVEVSSLNYRSGTPLSKHSHEWQVSPATIEPLGPQSATLEVIRKCCEVSH